MCRPIKISCLLLSPLLFVSSVYALNGTRVGSPRRDVGSPRFDIATPTTSGRAIRSSTAAQASFFPSLGASGIDDGARRAASEALFDKRRRKLEFQSWRARVRRARLETLIKQQRQSQERRKRWQQARRGTGGYGSFARRVFNREAFVSNRDSRPLGYHFKKALLGW